MYYINKFGIEKHLEKRNDKTLHEDYYRKLLGKVSFCLQVNKKDEQILEYKETLIELIKRNKN